MNGRQNVPSIPKTWQIRGVVPTSLEENNKIFTPFYLPHFLLLFSFLPVLRCSFHTSSTLSLPHSLHISILASLCLSIPLHGPPSTSPLVSAFYLSSFHAPLPSFPPSSLPNFLPSLHPLIFPLQPVPAGHILTCN